MWNPENQWVRLCFIRVGLEPFQTWPGHYNYKLEITTPKRETKFLFRAEYFFLLQ